jgi:hypothetical protein
MKKDVEKIIEKKIEKLAELCLSNLLNDEDISDVFFRICGRKGFELKSEVFASEFPELFKQLLDLYGDVVVCRVIISKTLRLKRPFIEVVYKERPDGYCYRVILTVPDKFDRLKEFTEEFLRLKFKYGSNK